MSTSEPRPYHHGDLAQALIAATRTLLEEGGPAAVSLREAARRVGVSPTATYRHFKDKNALLAATAADGFDEFGRRLADAAAAGQNPLAAMGLAYVRFALEQRGLFRLMFGPQLAGRAAHPALEQAASAAFARLRSGVEGQAPTGRDPRLATISAWALVHGLAHLFLDGLLPEAEADALTRGITSRPATAPQPGTPPPSSASAPAR
jgi:AcrR family transcriptional regulator